MLTIIKNEIIKVFAQKLVYIFMALIAACYIIPAAYNKLFPLGVLKDVDMSGQSASMDVLGELFPNLFPLLIIIFVVILLADEYANGTLKMILLRPVSRIRIFISKVATFGVTLAILMGYALLLGYLVGTIFEGWGTGLHIGELSFGTWEGILITVRSFLMDMLVYFVYGVMLLFVSLFFSNTGAAMGAGLCTAFALIITSEIAEELRDYFIPTYFNFHNMLITDMDQQKIITACIVILAYFAVFFTAGLYTFKRKDILI